MNDHDIEDLVSAALDGEAVDLPALRNALATAEGRDLLASCVMIRATAVAADIEPSDQFAERLRTSAVASRRGWWLAGPRIPATVAASFVALAIAGTLFAGRATRSAPTAGDVARVGSPPAAVADSRGSRALPEPPKPSKVLRFDDWRHGG